MKTNVRTSNISLIKKISTFPNKSGSRYLLFYHSGYKINNKTIF